MFNRKKVAALEKKVKEQQGIIDAYATDIQAKLKFALENPREFKVDQQIKNYTVISVVRFKTPLWMGLIKVLGGIASFLLGKQNVVIETAPIWIYCLFDEKNKHYTCKTDAELKAYASEDEDAE